MQIFPFWDVCSQAGQRSGVWRVKKSKNSSQMKKSKKCVLLHDRGELAKNSTQANKWKKCWAICSQGGQKGPELGGSRNWRILRKWRNRRNAFFSTYEENSQRISRKRRNRRYVGSYVPKLTKRPELGGSRNRRILRKWRNRKNAFFSTYEENSRRIPRKRRNRRNVGSYVP